ncbi:MAG: hypothetical protein RAP03_17780, partial [Candidatus Electryonea clarkiae]|nr:hypothetical protein [Candidatus Electryonea clarkiae]
LVHLSSKAQMHFKKPTSMGGGNNTFDNFVLSTLDYGSLTTNCYRVEKDAAISAAEAKSVTQEAIAGGLATIYIVGYGTEIGNDDTNVVQAVSTVTATGVVTAVIN